MTCQRCGAALVLDTRARREVCSTCSRGPAMCICQPTVSAFVPVWVQRMKQNAKVLDHGRAA